MDSKELLSKIRRIEIKTRRMTSQVFAGEYHSAFKGQGMAFSEVREYQYGDPIRNIDWNVTARFNRPFIKVFEEERELTVMLLVDVSGSNEFGTAENLKREYMTEVAAVIAFSAIQNNDKIGVIFFTDQIEKFIPPKKGKKHIMRIILELLNFQPERKTTDVSNALKYLTNAIKKRSTAFLLSDFIETGVSNEELQNSLTLANKKHDLVGLLIQDKGEFSLPNIGLSQFRDPETGEIRWIDTSDKKLKQKLSNWWNQRNIDLDESFRRSGVDYATIQTDQDYVQPLMKLFKRRGQR
ncbi:MAG: DUF58 domain-containing protein [Bacteroidetes bacterium]|nr:DUF58 domain-containing protein [Bacteroidota bacterium]MBT3751568.1 DUF58 domain-containing protein [Bacteroidota bacterium]MBT4401646.1 DUF58 domain-containing protein [Bacteroidota bacterium]MBT4408521.1 DUF58 domain-containing protein [Bacteroidota bacterium]MBT7095607.1 DUF58 domain-containing protein [Bacteroidota bacterium]